MIEREKIKEIVERHGGSIDSEGKINGIPLCTPTIKDILKLGGEIYFNDLHSQMEISNWPALATHEIKIREWSGTRYLTLKIFADEGKIELAVDKVGLKAFTIGHIHLTPRWIHFHGKRGYINKDIYLKDVDC